LNNNYLFNIERSNVVQTFVIAIVTIALYFFMVGHVNAQNIIEINSPEGLDSIRDNMEGDYKLTSDVDLSNWGNWEPIGDLRSSTFEGTFDGNGYTIKNFQSNTGGIFGRTRNATFKNFKMTNIDINAKDATVGAVSNRDYFSHFENIVIDGTIHGSGVGGLVYDTQDGTFNNVHVNLEISTGSQYAGGIVGRDGHIINSSAKGNIYANGFGAGGLAAMIGSIKDSYSEMNVESTGSRSDFTGGLVGDLQPRGEIQNSYVTGNVYSTRDHVGGLVGRESTHGPNTIKDSYVTGNVEGRNYVGGLVGYTYEITNNISGSYSKDNTVKGNKYVGGFVGLLQGDKTNVTKSFSSSIVLATDEAENIGGFVGELASYAKIKDSFARGSVEGITNVGGFVGNNRGSTIERSYATGKVNGEDNTGGFVGRDSHGNYGLGANDSLVAPNFYDRDETNMNDEKGPISLATSEMKRRDTFTHWDFTSTWKIETGDYPTLRDQPFDLLTDIPSSYWGRDDVTEIIESGIMAGSEDIDNPGKFIFRPGADITRAEFAIVIVNALGAGTGSTSTGFSDDGAIPSWAKGEVSKAKELGIVYGDTSGNFNPSAKISRAEIAAMIARAYDLPLEGFGGPQMFEDETDIPSWAQAEVGAVVAEQIMSGQDRSGKIYFAPNDNAQRVEAGIAALRAYNN